VPGMKTYLSGAPALNHDTQKIYNDDLAKGEMIAVPIALLVLLFMFGTLGGALVPFVFAAATIPTTLGIVWILAHWTDMAIYVENIVTLIGLAIAIDYSMLIVFRYREQLDAGDEPGDALRATMATAGRATIFSGLTVAVGLALLVLMPLPFMRSMGLGGLFIPLVSIAASATLLPALLAVLGRGVNRFRIVPRRVLAKRAHAEGGFWSSLARSIMRRPIPYLLVSAGIMLALVAQAFRIDITAGDNRGTPKTTEATKGLALLESSLGPGALQPNILVVDTGRAGRAWDARSLEAQRTLARTLGGDPEVARSTIVAPGLISSQPGRPAPAALRRLEEANLVDPSGRYLQFRVAGRDDIGTPQAADLVDRMREDYVPQARFPGAAYLTGGAPFGVDFVNKAYGAFPWLIVAVLVISYLLLLRAFRSLLLPLKAVLMNVLSVGATYGVLVLVFQDNVDGGLFKALPQVEGWIPIFLFAMLFGALDGLRGVPALEDARGVGPHPRQRGRSRAWAGAHRAHHHRRRDHHDRRLLGVHVRLVRRPPGVRGRARRRDPARRDGGPDGPGAGDDEADRRLELVPARRAPARAAAAAAPRVPDPRNEPLDRRLARRGLDLVRDADHLELLDALLVGVARADDPEPAGADRRVGDDREAADLFPAEPLDLERVHPHLGRRERAALVVLVDRLRDRLEVLGLRGRHPKILT
jgi:MMPL family